MIVQMTRAALEWEERNPFEYDDGSPDPLLRALRELRAAPEKLRVDPKTLARCRLRRRDEEAVVIEAGFVGGGRTDRADLEPAQTIVLSRFGLEEVDHDSAGPPQAWKGRMILDHGYAQPDADLVALLRVTSARREVVTIFLDGDISVPPPPSSRPRIRVLRRMGSARSGDERRRRRRQRNDGRGHARHVVRRRDRQALRPRQHPGGAPAAALPPAQKRGHPYPASAESVRASRGAPTVVPSKLRASC